MLIFIKIVHNASVGENSYKADPRGYELCPKYVHLVSDMPDAQLCCAVPTCESPLSYTCIS